MKPWWVLGMLWVASGLGAEPTTVINALADRPVFNLSRSGVVETRTIAPGERLEADPALFSGLGDKNVPLASGTTYYLARWGAFPRLYQLTSTQVFILNQAGRAVALTLGPSEASAVLATGNWALGDVASGGLAVTWEDGSPTPRSVSLTTPGVYRLVLDSPEGTGTIVNLIEWK